MVQRAGLRSLPAWPLSQAWGTELPSPWAMTPAPLCPMDFTWVLAALTSCSSGSVPFTTGQSTDQNCVSSFSHGSGLGQTSWPVCAAPMEPQRSRPAKVPGWRSRAQQEFEKQPGVFWQGVGSPENSLTLPSRASAVLKPPVRGCSPQPSLCPQSPPGTRAAEDSCPGELRNLPRVWAVSAQGIPVGEGTSPLWGAATSAGIQGLSSPTCLQRTLGGFLGREPVLPVPTREWGLGTPPQPLLHLQCPPPLPPPVSLGL